MSIQEKINKANERVVDIFTKGRPVWTDVLPAIDVIPNMTKNTVLVAGPPIDVEDIVFPVKTAICGAVVYEGLADNIEQAWAKVLSGEIIIKPAQDYNCACGAAMATSASMPVIVCEDSVYHGKGFCTPHPGPAARVLRWGFYDNDVHKDLVWFRDIYGPALGMAVKKLGGIDLVSVLAKTAGMGDENHVRQFASSMYTNLKLIEALLDCDVEQKKDVIKALIENERFFLHVMMAGSEAITASAKKVPYSSVLVGLGGNGVELGMQFAGTGNEWFTAPAPKILGSFLSPTYTEDDVLGFLGDSCVTEVYGLGGFSATAGPSFVRLSGGTYADAIERTERTRAVSLSEHKFAPIPWDDFRGFPVCIDMRKVVAFNILPISHGGSTLKVGGQGGAGFAELPMECFKKGLIALSSKVQEG